MWWAFDSGVFQACYRCAFLRQPAEVFPSPHHVCSSIHLAPQHTHSRCKKQTHLERIITPNLHTYLTNSKQKLQYYDFTCLNLCSLQCMVTIQTHELFRKFVLFLSREEQCLDICVCLEGSHTLCLLGKHVCFIHTLLGVCVRLAEHWWWTGEQNQFIGCNCTAGLFSFLVYNS